ncbi:MAG: hypothetical protein SPL40_07905 [Erysipelotrichaceae bacterium]|nr:hypothetical protein [Erysipelotrichaceae bacterium]
MRKVKLILAGVMSLTLAACKPNLNIDASATAEASSAPEYTITNSVDLVTSEADMTGYQWLYDTDPPFVETTFQESIRMFTEKGSGILYYGRTNCPWCQRAVPVLDEVAQETGVTIYYIDASQPLATAADGSVDATKSQEVYQELLGYISPILEKDKDGKPAFQIPEVIGVKNGEIVGHHLSLVGSFSLDSEDAQMNDEQVAELKDIYRRIIAATAD